MNEGRRKRAEALEKGLCTHCFKRKPQPGRRKCTVCLKEARVRESRRSSIKRKKKLCRMCRKRPARPDRSTCPPCAQEWSVYMKGWVKRHRLQMLTKLSGGHKPFCRCCGERLLIYLTVDHVEDNGAEDRRGVRGGLISIYKKVLDGKSDIILQVLCWNCQWAKRLNKGICPRTGKNLRIPPTQAELDQMARE